MKDIAILGIDLGKSICSLVGLDDAGAVAAASRIISPPSALRWRRPACSLSTRTGKAPA